MSTDLDSPRYFSLLENPDRDASVSLCLGLADSGVPVEDILLRLIAPAQVRVGTLWEQNLWTVAQEHAATAVADASLGAVTAYKAPLVEERHIVLACVEGEWHSFPARMAAELFRLAGWQVTFLGASTPYEGLEAYLERTRPDVLGISCTMPYLLSEAESFVERAHAASIPVIAGGRAFGADGARARAIGADFWQIHPMAEMIPLSADSAAPQADREQAKRLWASREQLAQEALGLLRSEVQSVDRYDKRKIEHTIRDFQNIAQYGSATLLTGDERLFQEFIDWLAGMLEARGVSRAVLGASLHALARASARDLPGMKSLAEREAARLAA